MSYVKQLRNITGYDDDDDDDEDGILHSLTCCSGKVYALHNVHSNRFLVHIDIAFIKDRAEVVISLLRSVNVPNIYRTGVSFLKGWCAELFYIKIAKALGAVCLFKLDMTSMEWEEIEDLKEGIFFVDLAHEGFPVYYSHGIASELGGYVHILRRKVIHSYNVKNRTVSLSSLPSPLLRTSLVSLWDSSLQRDHGHGDIKRRANNPEQEEDKKTEIVARSVSDDKVLSNNSWIEPYNENNESSLLNIPLDVLKMIMEFCVGIEYLKFRATCKHCQMAAPVIGWSKNETTLEKLQTYSLASPWLMVFDKHQGIITFTDPLFGDKYFIKTLPDDLIGDIHYSSFGWLLIRKYPWTTLVFFNPFTSDMRYLPPVPCLESCCFSAPPTSPDCIVVGFRKTLQQNVYIHVVAGRESYWHVIHQNLGGVDAPSFRFPTFHCGDLYALCDDGGLDSFIDIDKEEDYTRRHLIAKSPRNCCGCLAQSFLTKCDKHLLLVIVSEYGESIEVFKLNGYREWEKIDSLGRYVIYICDATCFCNEAKTPEMESKIYFPRLRNEKIVFYSLETRKYHTIDKNVQESFGDFLETKHHLNLHAWIEPNWHD